MAPSVRETVRKAIPDGLPVIEAAKVLGVTPSTLYNVLAGKCRVSPKMALLFNLYWDLDPVALMQQQVREELVVAMEALCEERNLNRTALVWRDER